MSVLNNVKNLSFQQYQHNHPFHLNHNTHITQEWNNIPITTKIITVIFIFAIIPPFSSNGDGRSSYHVLKSLGIVSLWCSPNEYI